MRNTLLLGLLLPLSAAAQRLDIGLTGATRLSFTDWVPSNQIYNASKRGVSAAAGVEASYTFRGQRFRVSTGAMRGQLVQAIRLRTPEFGLHDAPALEFRSVVWQVPLRLHCQVVQLGRKGAINLRTGMVWQINANAAPRIGGDFRELPTSDPYLPLPIEVTSSPNRRYALYPARWQKESNLLVETGAEFSYALSEAVTIDAGAVYQAGLRTVRTFTIYRDIAAPAFTVLTASSKGNNLLFSLTARYALTKASKVSE